MKRLACLSVLILCGCAKEGAWEKRGATDHDFHMDRGQCVAQMESVPASQNQKLRVFIGCMQGKGWYWTEKL